MRNYSEQRNKSHALFAILKSWHVYPKTNRKLRRGFKQEFFIFENILWCSYSKFFGDTHREIE